MDCCCWEGRGGVRNGRETIVEISDTDHLREEHGLLLLGREGRGKEWGRDKS